MNILEVVQLVIQSGTMAKCGEIFVLDIVDLVNNLITLDDLKQTQMQRLSSQGLDLDRIYINIYLILKKRLKNTEYKQIFIEKSIEFYIDRAKNIQKH